MSSKIGEQFLNQSSMLGPQLDGVSYVNFHIHSYLFGRKYLFKENQRRKDSNHTKSIKTMVKLSQVNGTDN